MILLHLPIAPPLFPPPAVHYLANYLQQHGIAAEVVDINTDLYRYNSEMWKLCTGFSANYNNNKGFHVFINKYFDGMFSFLKKKQIDFIGYSCFDSTYEFFQHFISRVKKKIPDAINILGGPDVYERHQLYIPLLSEGTADYIVLKEGEQKLLAIIKKQELPDGVLSKNNMKWPSNNIFKDTNVLDIKKEAAPLINISNFSKLYKHTHILPIYASRGCPANCIYCAHKIFWEGYRSKTPEQVVREMNLYYRRHHVKAFYFTDMLLNGNPKWLENFIHLLEINPHKFLWSGYMRISPQFDDEFLSRIAGAGCTFMFYGIESNSQNVLNTVKKGTRVDDNETVIPATSRVAIFVHASLILGLPYETFEDMISTLVYVKNNVWNMDHIEIHMFENFMQSPGYDFSKNYLENYVDKDDAKLKQELYDKYIVPFNMIGNSLLNIQYLFSDNTPLYKKSLNKYYEMRLAGYTQDQTVNELKDLFPKVVIDNDYCQVMKRIYKAKLSQIGFLNQIMSQLQ